MSWFVQVLKKYVVFKGRARRKEFWMYTLFYIIFGIVANIIDRIIGSDLGGGTGVISTLYFLALLLPSLAVTVRRLHDTERSGGWIFLVFFIFIGWIWLFVLMCLEGKPGENKYGPNPKESTGAAG